VELEEGQIRGTGTEVPQWGTGAKPREGVSGGVARSWSIFKVQNLKFKAM